MEHPWLPPKFQWIPGKDMNLNAIEEMKQCFHKPVDAPPEAWFMDPSTQNYYTWLLSDELDEISAYTLERYLFDTGGGIRSFGRYKIWVEWFLYLLPHLLLRVRQGELGLIVSIANYFFNIYPFEIFDEYGGFRQDIFWTLVQGVMAPTLWDRQDISKSAQWYGEWEGYWTDPLYILVFFCLKYLQPEEIPIWVDSIAKIEGAFWREQIRIWLVGAEKFCGYITDPERAALAMANKKKEVGVEDYLKLTGINWDESYIPYMGGHRAAKLSEVLRTENIEAFWAAVRRHPELTLPPSSEKKD
jgi:hypothetical protein